MRGSEELLSFNPVGFVHTDGPHNYGIITIMCWVIGRLC